MKMYSETIVYEVQEEKLSVRKLGKRVFRFLFNVLLINRNNIIEKRIARIRAASQHLPWQEMSDQDRINYIYRKMAEEKAIERMILLKN